MSPGAGAGAGAGAGTGAGAPAVPGPGDRYELRRRLASGGMAVVWEARDRRLNRPVAVKVLSETLAGDPPFVARFRREARVAATIDHRNVCRILDYGESGSRPFIVMELLHGRTLAERLREGPVPAAEATRIAAQVADGLEAAHRAGIVHRDVKPDNVMLLPDGPVKVMDFGIAATAGDTRLTATNELLGTAAYLAPERGRGLRATPASDVYSLGVLLYEMLAGRPPFQAETPVATVLAHVHRSPPPLAVPGTVPPDLADLCMRALAKEPAARPESAGAFARALRAAASVPAIGAERPTVPHDTERLPAAPGAEPPGTPGGPRRARSRRRWRSGAAAGLALALLAAVLVWATHRAPVGTAGRPNAPVRPATAGAPATSSASPPASPSASPSPTPSASPSPSAVVPPVAGLPVPAATSALESAGYTVTVQYVKGGPPGTVEGTDPGAGAALPPGQSVTLLVHSPPGQDQGDGGS